MKRWKPSEIEQLRRLKPTKSNAELAEIFGTTHASVAHKCSKLGLKRDLHDCQPNKIRLTYDQELWLKLNYPHIATSICGMLLGISRCSVIRQAQRLGLQKTPQFLQENKTHANNKRRDTYLRNLKTINTQSL